VLKVALERHAVKRAEALYSDYMVADVGATQPYDLHATNDAEEIHIEVKGSSGTAEKVELTRNEVDHAHGVATHLVVVDQIEWRRLPSGEVQTSGGRGGAGAPGPRRTRTWKRPDTVTACLTEASNWPTRLWMRRTDRRRWGEKRGQASPGVGLARQPEAPTRRPDRPRRLPSRHLRPGAPGVPCAAGTVSRRLSVAHRPGAGGGRGGLPPAGLAVPVPRGARRLDLEQNKSAADQVTVKCQMSRFPLHGPQPTVFR
jgi:hypothetical protein